MVTLPPILIDNGDYRDCFNVVNHFIGPFEYSGPNRQYLVLRNQNFGTPNLRIFVSLDAGLTWGTGLDTANEPTDTGGYDVTQQGTVLHIVYTTQAGSGLKHISFDTATGLYGAVTSGGPTPTITFRSSIASTGEIIVSFPIGFNANNKIQFTIFSGGVWSAAADLVAADANRECFLQNQQIDVNDLIHVYYNTHNINLGGFWTTFTKAVTKLGVVGAENTITTTQFENLNIGRPTVLGTKLVIPVIEHGTDLAATFVSDDLTGATWQPIVVVNSAPALPTSDDVEVFSLTTLDGLTAYIFWITLDYNDVSNVIDRLYFSSSVDGVTWTTPSLMYDAVLNPQLDDPTVLPEDQDLHTLSVSQLIDLRFGIYTAMEENSLCAGYYLIDGASTCVIEFIPEALAGVIVLPGISAAHYNQPIIAFELGGEEVTYTITGPNPLPDGLDMTNPTGGEVTQTGPIVSDTGVMIAGQPVYSDYTSPVVTSVLMHVRLTA